MFEIRYRDAMGRSGRAEIGAKTLETPCFFPVINPKSRDYLKEIKEMGIGGVITNSYILYRDGELRKEALEKGIHGFLDFDGVVMTDSGSYQLYEYGSVDVKPDEIVEFQYDIGSDIAVMLDIPTPPRTGMKKVEEDLEETLRRARACTALERRSMLAGTVQGGERPELRERSAKEMGRLGFDVYAIGGVVPLMEGYRFSDLASVILHSKRFLPVQKPVHLFGAGHPMVLPMIVALGCDLFDSAAYALYAREGRYMTPDGTSHLEGMLEFPCSCELCSRNTPQEVMEMDREEGERFLALHNLKVTLEEVRRVKNAVHEGSLWELVERRARSHPYLLEALRSMVRWDGVERFDPVTKRSAFFYSGPESLGRPEVRRHLQRLKRIKFRAGRLVLLPDARRPYSNFYGVSSGRDFHVCILSPVFGIIPTEVEEVYPLMQHEGPEGMDRGQREFMVSTFLDYSKDFEEVLVHGGLSHLEIEGESLEDLADIGPGDEEVKLRAIADYQFGSGAGELLFEEIEVERSRTGRIRRISSQGKLLATLRASDGLLVPSFEGAKRLLKLEPPENRVVIEDDEVCGLVRDGKSVFARFVSACGPEIRPGEEVLVVDGQDGLLATGRAVLNGGEMLAFERGVAVRVRSGYPSTK